MAAPVVRLSNGLSMPAFGLGTWLAKEGEVGAAVKAAIDAGYRHLDCALVYQNEREIGAAIREKINDGTVKREDLFIVSKLWNTYHKPELVLKGCKKTLRNFGLDYIDLYLVHWPFAFKPTERADQNTEGIRDWDLVTIDEEFWPRDASGDIIFGDDDYLDTWREMEKLVQMGLTRSIGVSNFNSKQLDRLLKVAKVKPVNNQVEVHPLFNQKKLIEFCKARDIVVTAYSPLGSPARPNQAPRAPLLQNDKLLQVAKELNKTPGQIALRYLVEIGTIPIPKSTNFQRMKENISVFDFKFSPSQRAVMDSLNIDDRTCIMDGCQSHKDYPFRSGVEF